MRRLAALLLANVLAGAAAAQSPSSLPPLRFVAATNNALPIAQFDANERLVGGIVKDLGELIAAGLDRQAVFVPMAGKRVSAALLAGEADAVCFVLPQWLQGDFRWTRGLIPDASLVAAHVDAPALRSLEQLAGQPLGTVQGYNYPHAEQALGKWFRRADVPSMAANLRRLAAGKLRYALVEKTSLQFFLHEQPHAPVRIAWVINQFDARCAFSPRSGVPFPEVAQVLDRLVSDGSIQRALAPYR
ncbi:ABC-type amino acid transport substrate-binding protein [Pelomonas saccharophila]|uniref:ABC-type amino acid transport substrate-binding protein n=1 Tax=Roseateles saccharophilus TaxID=304 RepID=A0ABU1YH59_ROSSA|nr:transporter substrate-binding domain-containing protein [Roseateles saccharophilus]MDR7268197.1 ABC-type amino acid transport substrate-binding protein [Roseateles saccharophilus]